MSDSRGLITLAHGNGGRFMRELIREVFAPCFANPWLDTAADASLLPGIQGDLMVTTDGFIVEPLEFPGGDIGSLAVHGTVNDLAVSGAIPRWLTLSFLIEEGFEIDRIARLAASMGNAARECGVAIIAGDTKVLPRGQGGGVYISASGIGTRAPGVTLGMPQIRAGDLLIVNGPVGDHGAAVLLARQAFGLSGALRSDCGSVLPYARSAMGFDGIRFMRDPTRGGIATVANEISLETGLRVVLDESTLPVSNEVQGVCDMLGYDPLYLASEGRIVAVIDPDQAEPLLTAWRGLPGGERAAIAGCVVTGRRCVTLRTTLGGERLLDELEDDPLPRIC